MDSRGEARLSFGALLREIRDGFEPAFWVANISEIFERLAYYGAFSSLANYLHESLNLPVEQTGSLAGLFGGMVWFLAILGGAFFGEERGRAIGTWAAVGAVAGAVGPIVGGWLIDTFGWRIIFMINIPVAVAAGFLAWKFVAEQKERANSDRLDVLGAALATVALGLLTWSLTEAASAHQSSV